ncbi:MAG TPA: LysM peptidoglycan-binding domain-containing protein [Steroidobacteraceae bacterium]|nr:LysM peptidoglycan-binding domain-containing protein [Steroidobacteraceae bacterium]
MVSNQSLGPRTVVGLLALLVSVAGCSSWGHRHADQAPSSAPPAAQAASEAGLDQDQTATDAALAGLPAQAEQAAAAPAPSSDIINPNAPKSYTVKRGDTLWGIASMFLKDPWLWPEVWYINPKVANPHLIYPGDVLTLAYASNGSPQIRLQQGGPARLDPRLRSTPLNGAIPTIPYSSISAFLSRPTVVTNDQIKSAPYVLAFREEHLVGGSGHEIYVRDLNAAANERFTVVHLGDELRDPDDGKVIGYEGIYTATALVSKPGNPAKAVLTDTARETLMGDKLIATDMNVPVNFQLRAPQTDVHGSIIDVIDSTLAIGQYDVVVINRGKRHGVDAGVILAVDEAGATVVDRGSEKGWMHVFGSSFEHKVRLPDERGGTLLVFKSFDRVSYALVVGAITELHVGDTVRNP